MSARKVARKLYVYSQPWKVVFSVTPVIEDQKEVFGVTDSDTRTITVSSKPPVEVQRATLWHESLHAYWVAKDHPEGEEECIVNSETAAMSVFYDPRNKWFLEFMFREALDG